MSTSQDEASLYHMLQRCLTAAGQPASTAPARATTSSSQDAARLSQLLQECAAAARQPVSTAPAQSTSSSSRVAGRLKRRHEREGAAGRTASAAQAMRLEDVAESLERVLKSASTTTTQDRSSQATSRQAGAAAASCWGKAVPALKDLPAAAANRATSLELCVQGIACMTACLEASMLYPLTNQPPTAVSAQHGTHSRPGTAGTSAFIPFNAHKSLVEDLKVCMATKECIMQQCWHVGS